MLKTRVCHLLGIEYPIIQGGMINISNPELAAAVSRAGGLGIIGPDSGMTGPGDLTQNLKASIARARALTSKPFGVNLPVSLEEDVLDLEQVPQLKEVIDLVVAEGVRVVTTSGGDPVLWTRYLKDRGVSVLHVVASVHHARRAEAAGVDAVIAEGYEAGGANGRDELPTPVLVPQVVEAVGIPVLAAGGIMDARGFVAALALGAEGVQMGTRFIATRECVAHPRFKEALVQAGDTDTVITGRRFSLVRVLKNPVARRILEMEAEGRSPEEIRAYIGSGRSRLGQLQGDLEQGQAFCGAGAGLIHDVVPAAEVVRRLVEGAEEILGRLNRLFPSTGTG